MLQRFRCKNCGATLMFCEVKSGIIEIMCRITRCKTVNVLKCEDNQCNHEVKIFNKNIARQNQSVL